MAAIGPIIGGLISLTGILIAFRLTNKSAERRHKEQLLHEDRKKAIEQLAQLSDSREGTPWQWAQKITEFLHTFPGNHVPEDLRDRVRNEMQALESKIEAAFPDDFVGEEELSIEEEQEALLEELGPEGLEIDEKRTKLRAELGRLAVSFARNPTSGKIEKGPSVPRRPFRVLRRLGKRQAKG